MEASGDISYSKEPCLSSMEIKNSTKWKSDVGNDYNYNPKKNTEHLLLVWCRPSC